MESLQQSWANIVGSFNPRTNVRKTDLFCLYRIAPLTDVSTYIIIPIILLILIINRLATCNPSEENTSRSYGQPSLTNSGHMVRSKAEKKIADFLARQDLSYLYEPKLLGFRPDFYLPRYKLIIEYWGLALLDNQTGTSYRKSMLHKLEVYHKHGYRVISLFAHHLQDISYQQLILSEVLKALS